MQEKNLAQSSGAQTHLAWQTAGRTLAWVSKASSLAALKLLTPMDRTRPSFTSVSMAAHVSRSGGCTVGPRVRLAGQWICRQGVRS